MENCSDEPAAGGQAWGAPRIEGIERGDTRGRSSEYLVQCVLRTLEHVRAGGPAPGAGGSLLLVGDAPIQGPQGIRTVRTSTRNCRTRARRQPFRTRGSAAVDGLRMPSKTFQQLLSRIINESILKGGIFYRHISCQIRRISSFRFLLPLELLE